MIDMAVLGYFHALRINGWIGNLALLVEHEFFGQQGPGAKLRDRHGHGGGEIHGLRVEDHIQRIGEQLMPLLDRCNRMMLRNLKALSTLRQRPTPSVNIGSAGQVNVATNQTGVVQKG